MRKRIKTITEVTHEYGTISMETPLYETLLDHVGHSTVTDKHIDMIIEKTIKCTEEEDGDALTTEEHLAKITEGQPQTPALAEAAAASK